VALLSVNAGTSRAILTALSRRLHFFARKNWSRGERASNGRRARADNGGKESPIHTHSLTHSLAHSQPAIQRARETSHSAAPRPSGDHVRTRAGDESRDVR